MTAKDSHTIAKKILERFDLSTSLEAIAVVSYELRQAVSFKLTHEQLGDKLCRFLKLSKPEDKASMLREIAFWIAE